MTHSSLGLARCRAAVLLLFTRAAQPQAARSIETGRIAPQRCRLRAERAVVVGLVACLPGRIQPRSHATLGIPELALGYPRSRRRSSAPGSQGAAAPVSRGLRKRKDLIREMLDSGAELVREGGNHTIFRNGRTGTLIPVPRHHEIGEPLARKIVRDAKR
jgi:mRNA interferase HicA